MNDTTALGGHHMKLDPQLHAVLDPGKWKMGLCLSYGGSLVYATAVHVSAPWDFTKAVNAVLDAAVAFNGSLPSHWAIEWPRFYGGQSTARDAALEEFARRGCRFLVFGRDTGAGFRVRTDLDLPEQLISLCRDVPAAQFRADISSTELRRQEKW